VASVRTGFAAFLVDYSPWEKQQVEEHVTLPEKRDR